MIHSRRAFLNQAGALLAGLAGGRLGGEEPVKVPAVGERLRQDAEQAPLALRFTGSSPEECRKWQTEFASKLRGLLGPHLPPAKWKTVLRRAVDFEDHRREELVLVAEGHPVLPVDLLLPRPRAQQRRAGGLALHGHGSHGHHPVSGRDDGPGVAEAIENANYDYGRQLARRGYVVAVPCFTPFGERLGNWQAKQDACADTFIRMQMLGKLLIAENLRDALWSL